MRKVFVGKWWGYCILLFSKKMSTRLSPETQSYSDFEPLTRTQLIKRPYSIYYGLFWVLKDQRWENLCIHSIASKGWNPTSEVFCKFHGFNTQIKVFQLLQDNENDIFQYRTNQRLHNSVCLIISKKKWLKWHLKVTFNYQLYIGQITVLGFLIVRRRISIRVSSIM